MKSCLLFMLASLCSVPLLAQPAASVPFQGPTPGFHQTHPGQILFSPTAVSVAGFPGAGYIGLSTYALGPHSRLYFTAFLGSSLTQALHRLAPHLPVQELARTGTYQFSFYVDKQLVYLANLPVEAVSADSRKHDTVLHQALVNPGASTVGWGQQLWYRFLSNGGVRALAKGQHLLRLEIRPYFQDRAVRDAPVLAAGQVALDVTAPVAAKLSH
ncbi:hypothetical protein [Hymenobacter tenuis]